ncbi:MAG: FAD-dependent oxidoreductase, partial [Bacteroidota bacterium]
IRLDHPPLKKIAKSKIFIVPWKDNLYWAGSRYLWHQIDSVPTASEREQLQAILDEVLEVNYEVVEHLASVRPVFKGRRPMVGLHPEHDNLFIFNGLGTKGASQAPYWADRLSDYMLGKVSALHPEADVRRISC